MYLTFSWLGILFFLTISIAHADPILNDFSCDSQGDMEAFLLNKFWFKDTDGDGIKDHKDACPSVPGLKKFNGCPDSDHDGIEDAKDYCPETAGLEPLKGCPDSDGDGFSDYEDLCPELFGLEAYNGCPDTDNDGVMDSKDDCPAITGPIENKGCPGKKRNDNLDDFVDETFVNETTDIVMDEILSITEIDLNIINSIAKGVGFKSASNIYNKTTTDQLDAIAQILKNFPNDSWQIEGYTDSIGEADANMILSEKRANSVRNYLLSKGLNPENFMAKGYGEKNPIDTNMYKKGRANNRRVEFKLIK